MTGACASQSKNTNIKFQNEGVDNAISTPLPAINLHIVKLPKRAKDSTKDNIKRLG
jgi:hypothetical protein